MPAYRFSSSTLVILDYLDAAEGKGDEDASWAMRIQGTEVRLQARLQAAVL